MMQTTAYTDEVHSSHEQATELTIEAFPKGTPAINSTSIKSSGVVKVQSMYLACKNRRWVKSAFEEKSYIHLL